MSQILATRPKSSTLYYDLHFEKPVIHLHSTVNEVMCHICKSKLKEGTSLTAKSFDGKIVLACSSHN